MNLCSDDHDEVCYEGRKCPACEKEKERASLEGEIANLNDKIDDLKLENDDLKSQIP